MENDLTPMRLDPDGRDLFALHEPAAAGARRSHGVLICNPFGQEAIRAHRFLRVLSENLYSAGFDVMRFDYFGTGDSAGTEADADLEGWVHDIDIACKALEARTQCRDMSLFGMGVGANLAARAASHPALRPTSVLLWDPVIDGRDYLQRLQKAHVSALARAFGARWATDAELRRQQLPDTHAECLGFHWTVQLVRDIEALCLERELAVLHAGAADAAIHLWSGAAAGLAGRWPALQGHGLDKVIDWTSDEALNTAIAPPGMVRAVVDALLPAHAC